MKAKNALQLLVLGICFCLSPGQASRAQGSITAAVKLFAKDKAEFHFLMKEAKSAGVRKVLVLGDKDTKAQCGTFDLIWGYAQARGARMRAPARPSPEASTCPPLPAAATTDDRLSHLTEPPHR